MWSSRKVSSEVRSALPLEAGERVLAAAEDASGRPLVGTQFALYVFTADPPGGARRSDAERRADAGADAGADVGADVGADGEQSEQAPRDDERAAAAGGSSQPDVRRMLWEQIERAEWDQDGGVLRVREVAAFGEPVRVSTLVVVQPEPLLQLIRERVTASIVFSQSVSVGSGNVRVVGRRRPGSDDELAWSFVFDAGADPNDPQVRAAAEQALTEARGQVGA